MRCKQRRPFLFAIQNLTCLAIGALALHAGAANVHVPTQSLPQDAVQCLAAHPQLDEEGFVSIGGIDQWVTIKGDDCSNPVILFVHGGPGNPLSPYANSPYRAWEKAYTLVQWDQRGAGRTYGRNPVKPETPESILTIERMATDGTDLAAYLVQHLKTRKVILFGSSWGSVLAVHMAKARPDLFVAYLGTGQLVRYPDNVLASYRKATDLARAAGDSKALAAIESLGEPPWSDPRSQGILRRITRRYEAKTSAPAPTSWWVPAPPYTSESLQADYDNGEEFSWLQYVGLKGRGMLSTLDLPKLGVDFAIPVFMVQGTEDLVTVPELAKAYFDSIHAPQKAYFALPHTGHDPNPAMIAAQYDILKTWVAPLMIQRP